MSHIPRNYIATLESTTITPAQGLNELRYLASVCSDDRLIPLNRRTTALALSKRLHVGRDTIQLHLRSLTAMKLISKKKIGRKFFRVLAGEDALAQYLK